LSLPHKSPSLTGQVQYDPNDEVVFVHANLLKEMPRSGFNAESEGGVFRVFKDYTVVNGNMWLKPRMHSSRRTRYARSWGRVTVVDLVWTYLPGKESRIFVKGRLRNCPG
jgi:hypothetical protein